MQSSLEKKGRIESNNAPNQMNWKLPTRVIDSRSSRKRALIPYKFKFRHVFLFIITCLYAIRKVVEVKFYTQSSI